jgi:hypothetical protein
VRRTSHFLGPFVLAIVVGVSASACGEAAPDDCGDPSMAIVTFQPPGTSDEDLRICVDIHAASRLDATATSPGLDESYAVTRPGVYPWTNVTFRAASEACGRAGKFLCDYDTLKAITPVKQGLGTPTYDTTAIASLPQTGPETAVQSRLDALNPYDMVATISTGKPPFPESTRSVAFWAVVPPKDDQYVDETAPYVIGSISGDKAIGGVLIPVGIGDAEYRHPLLGFRCCIDAKMRSSFVPLAADPARRRAAPDPEVHLAPPK